MNLLVQYMDQECLVVLSGEIIFNSFKLYLEYSICTSLLISVAVTADTTLIEPHQTYAVIQFVVPMKIHYPALLTALAKNLKPLSTLALDQVGTCSLLRP